MPDWLNVVFLERLPSPRRKKIVSIKAEANAVCGPLTNVQIGLICFHHNGPKASEKDPGVGRTSCFCSSATPAQLSAVSGNKGSLPKHITSSRWSAAAAGGRSGAKGNRGEGVPRWRADGGKQWNEKPTAWCVDDSQTRGPRQTLGSEQTAKKQSGENKKECLFICFSFFLPSITARTPGLHEDIAAAVNHKLNHSN